MKQAEVKQALPELIDRWAEATNQPMPPDGEYHYSFPAFWSWLESNHRLYTDFRAVPDARYVMEMWFDDHMKQAWRN